MDAWGSEQQDPYPKTQPPSGRAEPDATLQDENGGGQDSQKCGRWGPGPAAILSRAQSPMHAGTIVVRVEVGLGAGVQ